MQLPRHQSRGSLIGRTTGTLGRGRRRPVLFLLRRTIRKWFREDRLLRRVQLNFFEGHAHFIGFALIDPSCALLGASD